MAKGLRIFLAAALTLEIAAAVLFFFAQKAAEEQAAKQAFLAQEIAAWEKVLTERNETRNGLLNLARLHYQLYQDDRAKLYWQRAFYLDPLFVASLPVQLF